ncbi:MAG TPA: cupin domain-containing protein [Bauldia sp.]|nr:cupin domain-containing protein [Bauldia sp.]
MARFGQRRLGEAADVIAPDGSEVRLLVALSRGSMAHFRLAPRAISRAIRHATVEELWYFVSGRGRMWRKDETGESVIEVHSGMSIDIPAGTAFQFRADEDEPLEAVGVTMPPWPGPLEAIFVEGAWQATA